MKPDGTSGFASNPGGLVKLGCALMTSGRGGQAVALVEGLIAANPDDRVLCKAANIVLTHKVPRFHLAMLADAPRNAAYERAIARAAPGRTVLDIGAGSGLLSMMAVRAGATRVFACESNEALAATAREIVAANGMSERITVLAKNSTALDRDADLGGGVDLVISEIFSHNLIGEGALPSLLDAMTRLTRPGAAIVPARASVMVALAAHETYAYRPAGVVSGFDLSLFDRHVDTAINTPVGDDRLALRSKPAAMFAFDLSDTGEDRAARADAPMLCSGGDANGIVQWIRLGLDDDEVYENRPGAGASSHWSAVFHPLAEAIRSGELVDIVGWRDDHRLRIWSGREAMGKPPGPG